MLELLYNSPIRQGLTLLLMATSMIFACYSFRHFRRVVGKQENADRPMTIVRGLRGLIIALTTLAWAAGIYREQEWLLIIGLVILAQEMYEMGVLSLILRYGHTLSYGRDRIETPDTVAC
ncbi:hypothetical protein D3OALGA1CA_3359 [Olavius algarvensis associated proteobacterium Delta 3]|nr:hypothetical protein D3OALGB2SA_3119 [Olavius algarvensis associated proteobacterium Delta 3]CAB5133130.1 hypothetical protein D3OALGA1CA_3359 [Olavius algarvensis associated proteobacterium Delta 3]